jgi:hypothetical protein
LVSPAFPHRWRSHRIIKYDLMGKEIMLQGQDVTYAALPFWA